MPTTAQVISVARGAGIAVPAFNVPYLPMVEPVIRAAVEQDAFALVATARLEWVKFESRGPAAVMDEFARWSDPAHVALHLDHVPAIDEDGLAVDYLPIFRQAIALGYGSVMIDGSRLGLEANIAATRQVVELAHNAGIACEAELGAVLGHEAGPLPPYEELYASGRGFTDVDEARRFVAESGCDWLSVAIGNVHGAISAGLKDQKKIEARLNLEHLDRLAQATGIPLVLHGGSGIGRDNLLAAVKRGVAKINIAMDIRQAYERALAETGRVAAAQEAVYRATSAIIGEHLGLAGRLRLPKSP